MILDSVDYSKFIIMHLKSHNHKSPNHLIIFGFKGIKFIAQWYNFCK